MFKVAPKRRGKPARVTVGGELTIYTAAELKDRLLAVLQAGTGVEITGADVSEADTAGLQVLLSAKRYCDALQLPFVIVKPSEALSAALGVLGLDAALA